MKWQTHRLIGVGVALICDAGIVAAAISYLGSTLPDVVEGKPPQEGAFFFGRGMKNWRKNHRGTSHWFGWYLGLAFAGFYYDPIFAWLGIGAMTHLAADAVTPMGVPLLPFSKKKMFSINLFPTGSFREAIFSMFLMVGIAYYFVLFPNSLTEL